MPKFSLVVATLGRDTEVNRLLESLENQDYKDFEVIIVDQNKDDRITKLVDKFQNILDLKHFKVDFTGVARARDFGIQRSIGDIVAFPDDDCFYEKNVLSMVKTRFEEKKALGIISAATYDIENPDNFSLGNNSKKIVNITKSRLMGIEITLFFNSNVIKRDDLYLDHEFGLGALYKSTEGFEVQYRLLYQGYKGIYYPDIKIYHKIRTDSDNLDRIYINAFGEGAFIKKFLNKCDIGILYHFFRKMLIAPFVKIIKSIVTFDKNLLMQTFYRLKGNWQGFLSYKS